MIEVPAETGR